MVEVGVQTVAVVCLSDEPMVHHGDVGHDGVVGFRHRFPGVVYSCEMNDSNCDEARCRAQGVEKRASLWTVGDLDASGDTPFRRPMLADEKQVCEKKSNCAQRCLASAFGRPPSEAA